ncbi:MAG: extracellular solute-binding protein [Cohaesibacteraceae bacterium]
MKVLQLVNALILQPPTRRAGLQNLEKRLALAGLLTLFLVAFATSALAQTDTTAPDAPTAAEEVDPVATEPVDDRIWYHATSLNEGLPKYPEGFAHFDYVNPDAPTGGEVRLSDIGTFDTLNFVPPRGITPLGLGLIYDTLMTSSLDERSTDIGLLAEEMTYPDDYSSVTYRLREGAYWHDGEPVTVEDVLFSFNVVTEHNPQQAAYYSHVVDAEITGEREITFTFDQTGNRELPHIVGQLFVLPQHWWEGTDADGNQRDISRGTLEVPLGSGAYRIEAVTAGRSIRYERVEDYWAGDLNVNVGHYNFGAVEYDFYRDGDVAFEAFEADEFDFRIENRARNWATGYEIDAVETGEMVLEKFVEPYRRAGLMVGYVFNTQRPIFENADVRRAFTYMLDFQELNRSLFFDSYRQYFSYFTGLDALAASGLPEGAELALLEDIRAEGHAIPDEVFTEAFANPVTEGPESRRENIRQALEFFEAGGWSMREEVDEEQAPTGFLHRLMVTVGLASDPTRRVMRDEAGDPVVIELLLNGPTQEGPSAQFAQSLELVGIELVMRPVDSSQYTNRVRERDFDMIYSGWVQSTSPGNEQRDYFASSSATQPASRNYAGIENPAVDALIERIIFAPDREALETATRAMDRVLLWNHYVVPGWGQPRARVARWDRFGHPEDLPTYSIGFPTIWWYDEARAARIGGNGG